MRAPLALTMAATMVRRSECVLRRNSWTLRENQTRPIGESRLMTVDRPAYASGMVLSPARFASDALSL